MLCTLRSNEIDGTRECETGTSFELLLRDSPGREKDGVTAMWRSLRVLWGVCRDEGRKKTNDTSLETGKDIMQARGRKAAT